MGQLSFFAGVDMGDPATFYPADRWNPYGYYEQWDVITLNKSLLHGPYGKLSYFLLPSTRTIMKRACGYAEQIRDVAHKYQQQVIKCPRFSLTLPAWTAHGADIERMIICLREPIQVAQSIRKRNRDLTWHGVYLWYAHNKRLLEHIGDIPVWYVRYSHLIDRETSLQELGHAFRFLGHDLGDAELKALVAERVKPELRNHAQVIQAYPRPIQRLWEDLCARHAAQFE